jgi:hypothetical protein
VGEGESGLRRDQIVEIRSHRCLKDTTRISLQDMKPLDDSGRRIKQCDLMALFLLFFFLE